MLSRSIKKYYVSIYNNLIYKAIEKNLPLRALDEWYTLLKNLLVIFKIEEKELLVVARLLSIATNRPGKVKGIGNTVYPLGASYILK